MKQVVTRAFGYAASAACMLMPLVVEAHEPTDLSRYPVLDDKQLGQLNYIVRLSNQDDGDWSNMESVPDSLGADDGYRYQLAFMSYALNIAYYNYTPAYRELAERTSNNLIRKMFLFDSWSDWPAISKGVPMMDPDLKSPLPTRYDPAVDFVMYSGHLHQMLATHAMLFADDRFDQPDSITFSYPESYPDVGGKSYNYDLEGLTEELFAEFKESGWMGIECIPNAIFVMCNQHPILGFKAYDTRHGTKYFDAVEEEYKHAVAENHFLDHETDSWITLYRVKQDSPELAPRAWVDGWTGVFMHAWDRDKVESLYPTQRDQFVKRLADGTETVEAEAGDPVYSQDHGFMAALAAEVGDTKTQRAFLAYADRYYGPKWDGDAYYYPTQEAFKYDGDAPDVWRRVQPLASSALLAMARLTPEDGLYRIFNEPFDAQHFAEPFISDIAFPQIQVARAVYDPDVKALIFTLRPGATAAKGVTVAWKINNLGSGQAWHLLRDGKNVASIRGGQAIGQDGKPSEAFSLSGDSLEVKLPVTTETTFVLMQN